MYADLTTGKCNIEKLPSVLITAEGKTLDPTEEQCFQAGYRLQVSQDETTDGNKVLAYLPEAIDDKTCKLVAVSVVSIAEESVKLEAETTANEQRFVEWAEQAKLVDADFTTWSRHERFLLSLITKIAPEIDITKEYESLK